MPKDVISRPGQGEIEAGNAHYPVLLHRTPSDRGPEPLRVREGGIQGNDGVRKAEHIQMYVFWM